MSDLSDPALVAKEYADESRLTGRRRAWREFGEGSNPDEWTFDAIAGRTPATALEVGCGWGELAVRVATEAGADVTAFDLSDRMAGLAHRRGVRTAVADAQAMPFRDRSFELAWANAVLYHIPDLDRGLRETARVITDDGAFVASTFDAGRFPELFALVGAKPPDISFRADNGTEILERHFAHVEKRAGHHALVFPNVEEVRTYLEATITMHHLAHEVATFVGPLRTERTFAVFVCTRPIR
jgi:ubiquinone/menaquinone biosynthesis C-methylase UbiE